MIFLGLDTSSSRATVALTDTGRVISEKFSAEPKHSSGERPWRNNHAETLLSLIDSTLAAAGCRLDDLSGFAVANGPGSFTGLRIGVSTLHGLSYGSGLPVIGVSTLHACAFCASRFEGLICAILDARKQELYGALFRRRDDFLERITPDQVLSFQQLVELARNLSRSESILFAGDGVTRYGESLRHALGKQVFLSENDHMPSIASAVALLGEINLANGQGGSAAPLTLHYVRAPDAQVSMRKSA